MKRLLLLLFCIVLSAQFAAAEGGNRTRFDIGPKLGVNLSELDGTGWQAGYKTNLLGGLFMSVRGDHLGVSIEGLFSQTTYVTGQDFNSIYHTYIEAGKDSLMHGRFRLSYFNIPVLVQLRILGRTWLQAGVQYSGVVSVKDMDAFLTDAEGLFNTGSMAGVAGLWIDVTKHVNVGARYVMSWTNLNQGSIAEHWNQRNIQLHLGFTL